MEIYSERELYASGLIDNMWLKGCMKISHSIFSSNSFTLKYRKKEAKLKNLCNNCIIPCFTNFLNIIYYDKIKLNLIS